MIKIDKVIVPEVRILPMSKEEFPTFKECINFLTTTMVSRGYVYYYKRHSMKGISNSIILFQYDGTIIGYAILEDDRKLNKNQHIEIGKGYTGFYQFRKNSLVILKTFITNNEMQDNISIKLCQGTTRILQHKWEILEKLINKKCN